MNKTFGWLFILIALNMLLDTPSINIYGGGEIGGWISLILFAIIGIMALTAKGK